YAYIADGEAGFQVVNVADPANPVLVGGYDTSGFAEAVAVSGNRAYLLCTLYSGWFTLSLLELIDVSNPASPVSVGVYGDWYRILGMAVSGNCVYLLSRFAGLHVIDVSNSAVPTRVSWFDTPVSS
ncbi:MAG: hypothetical protein NZ739_02485, partial [Verrucomicrobiae bacterium]|nr:hypothetical protein [Verrucomicrobiae bacterium]